MTITNPQSGTTVHEIAPDIFRISTPIPPAAMPGGFSFNQILIRADAPLLFHTGPRRMFPLVHQAVAHVLGDAARLRFVSFSHFEADESGSLNQWLAAAPTAEPVCSRIAAMVSVEDTADRPPRALADGEELDLGGRRVRWLDTPHLPHGWESGYLFETTTRTLMCGDLFTQHGHERPPLTEDDILAPAEELRAGMNYFSVNRDTRALLAKLAATEPTTLATMHGSSYRGNGARLLLALADTVTDTVTG
jgi:flavorubredoxin